jgi:sugar lactone lactonase YvrE
MTREVRTLTGGIYFGEGPRWRDGRLWLSDFEAHAVKSVSLAGDLRTEFQIDDQPSGLGWLPNGDMIIVSMKQRRLLRRTADGALSLYADLSGIATWHCNDMVIDATGRAYVGNFGFDLDHAMAEQAAGREGDLSGVARLALVSSEGVVSEAAADLQFPNGSVITPDGRTLIVAETFGARLTAFDIAPDGDLSNRRVWAETAPRLPDGICLDAEGAVWIANPMAPECARIAEGGEVLEVIDTGQSCYACMLGGDDGRSLFMLTAPGLGAGAGSGEPRGKIMVCEVDAPHTGRP